MADVFLPSGRVRHFPLSEVDDGGEVRCLASGRRFRVRVARRFVDATHLETAIPLTHRRSFEVSPGVACVPPNELPRRAGTHGHFVVLGGGKTGLDCLSWLLDQGVAPTSIDWVISRDAWWVDRLAMQTGERHRSHTLAVLARQAEVLSTAASLRELAEGLEQAGSWLRLDPARTPTMFHAATVTRVELERARRCRQVRDGKVVRIDRGRLCLEGGTQAVPASALFIDCTASALARNRLDRTPVFSAGRIDLQMIRFPAICFSAALIGFIEAQVHDDAARAAMTRVTPMVDTVADWVERQVTQAGNLAAWAADPAVLAWWQQCRLDPIGALLRSLADDAGPDAAARDRIRALAPAVTRNLGQIPRAAR